MAGGRGVCEDREQFGPRGAGAGPGGRRDRPRSSRNGVPGRRPLSALPDPRRPPGRRPQEVLLTRARHHRSALPRPPGTPVPPRPPARRPRDPPRPVRARVGRRPPAAHRAHRLQPVPDRRAVRRRPGVPRLAAHPLPGRPRARRHPLRRPRHRPGAAGRAPGGPPAGDQPGRPGRRQHGARGVPRGPPRLPLADDRAHRPAGPRLRPGAQPRAALPAAGHGPGAAGADGVHAALPAHPVAGVRAAERRARPRRTWSRSASTPRPPGAPPPASGSRSAWCPTAWTWTAGPPDPAGAR